MKKDKISVIIPVYNAEEYLSYVLHDLRMQTYKNIEIILVNDGSTDNSASIMQMYSEMDERIKVINNTSNGGPSKARNIGLENACGEFIRFVDADDRIPKDSMEIMINAYTNNDEVDLVIGNFICEPKNNYFLGNTVSEGVVEAKDYVGHFIKYVRTFYYGVPWNKLYRKDIIDAYDLRFDESVMWCEDFLFNVDYYERCKKVYYVNTLNGVYTYCIRENSITGKMEKKSKNGNFLNIPELRYNKAKLFCEKYGMEEKFVLEWKYSYLYDRLSAVTKKTYSKSLIKRYKKFKSMLLDEEVYQYVSIKYRETELKLWKIIKSAIEKKQFVKPFLIFLIKGYMVLYLNPVMPIIRKLLQHILPKSL